MLVAGAVGIAGCGGSDHPVDPSVFEPRAGVVAAGASVEIRLPAAHQEDLLVRSEIPVRVRAPSSGRLAVRTWLRTRSGRSVALGKTRTAKLRARRWHEVSVPLSASGRVALADCSGSRIAVTAQELRGDRRRSASTKIRLGPLGCGRFFAPTTFWNSPVAGAPLDANSEPVTRELLRQVERGLRSGPPPTINTSVSAPPVVVVGADQPHVRVHLDRPRDYAPELAQAFASVPLPPDARPSAGTDSELIVWQPATDTLWEFWLLRQAADGWHAKWGGRLRKVFSGPGLFTESHEAWGESASGLPLAGGMITPAELRRGVIDHALGLGIPQARAHVFARPASRTDGVSDCEHAVPEGARFRLDPDLDIDALGLPRPVAALARAAQRYGIIVRDQAGAVAFYAQNTNSLAGDPYPALFEGRTPQELVAQFPWSHLELVEMELGREKGAPPPRPLDGLLDGCS